MVIESADVDDFISGRTEVPRPSLQYFKPLPSGRRRACPGDQEPALTAVKRSRVDFKHVLELMTW